MMQAEMKEIVEAEAVDYYLKLAAALLPAVAIVGLLTVWLAKRRFTSFACRAGVVGAVGPVVFGMWRLYSYLVRYDPESGYFGLQSVSVLLLSLLLFVVVGALFGTAAAYLTARNKHRKE